jgi:formylmethanofuran dehydrogenase subunit E-like metal-binding protein
MRTVIDRMMAQGRDGRVIEEGDYKEGDGISRHVEGDLRVISWWKSYHQNRSVVKLVEAHRVVVLYEYQFDPLKTDLGPHNSFCAGVMPGFVYADWLEENVPNLDERVLTLLRKDVGVTLTGKEEK